MAIVVIGLNHRTAPLAVLERVALNGEARPKALHDLRLRPNLAEVVLLSTCNRTEVYVATERFHGAYADIRDFFCSLAGLAPEELALHLVSQHDEEAATHLFEVAAGLRSAVLGESEILGQVRDAWMLSQREGTTRAALNLLFRRAVEVGKRARSETGIGRGTASVSHAAVEMAEERLGSLADSKVVVVGAGDVGEATAVALTSRGVVELVVANRTPDRGLALAEKRADQGEARPLLQSNDRVGQMRKLLELREPFYKLADFEVAAEQDAALVVAGVLDVARKHGGW